MLNRNYACVEGNAWLPPCCSLPWLKRPAEPIRRLRRPLEVHFPDNWEDPQEWWSAVHHACWSTLTWIEMVVSSKKHTAWWLYVASMVNFLLIWHRDPQTGPFCSRHGGAKMSAPATAMFTAGMGRSGAESHGNIRLAHFLGEKLCWFCFSVISGSFSDYQGHHHLKRGRPKVIIGDKEFQCRNALMNVDDMWIDFC